MKLTKRQIKKIIREEYTRLIRQGLLESVEIAMTVGQMASQYPDLWDILCESRDFDLNGYVPGSELMDQSLGDFIQQERLNTDNTNWWKNYYGNEWQQAAVALEVLADDVGWTRLSYSGLDFKVCYSLMVEACREFGIPEPTHLARVASDMNDNQEMDASLGSNWAAKMRNKFGLDD